MDSGATNNFISASVAAELGLQCVAAERMVVTLADGRVVDSRQTTHVPIVILDQEGVCVSVHPCKVSCRVVPTLSSPVVFGMEYLGTVNPVIDWAAHTVTFG